VTPEFAQQLKAQLVPVLQEQGFRGSARRFHRVSDPTIQVVELQSSRSGDACSVNLAQHFTFMRTVRGEVADARRIRSDECAFRWRLSPEGQDDAWWSYGSGEDWARRSVANLVHTLIEVGLPVLDRYRPFPGPFEDVVPAALGLNESSPFPGLTTISDPAATMAWISLHLGKPDLAADFARVGLKALDGRRTPSIALRLELEEALKAATQA